VFSPSAQHHDDKKGSSSSHNDYGASSTKLLNCKCLNCEKTVSANKYASHLENCLGIGRTSSRIASRKKTTNSSSYYDYPDYDDDPESDANWTAKEKTKKKPQGNGRNGKNKNKNYM
jgi:SAGA-associated factor 11